MQVALDSARSRAQRQVLLPPVLSAVAGLSRVIHGGSRVPTAHRGARAASQRETGDFPAEVQGPSEVKTVEVRYSLTLLRESTANGKTSEKLSSDPEGEEESGLHRCI